jgi:flagellar biosynthesis GTPase FlhF
MKFQFYFYIAVVFFASPVFAKGSLSAHLHGHVKLNVAADGKKLFLEVHTPSQSLLGFEQRPQTDQQKNIWTSVKNQWEKKISELFQIDPSLECKVTKAHIGMHFDEEEDHHHHDEANKTHKEESHDESEHHSHEKNEPLKEKEHHHHHDEANKAHKEKSHDESEHHSHEKNEPLKGEHSEIKAEAIFLCNKEIKNSQLVVRLKKYFPKIEKIEAQVLPNSGVPYSKTLKKDKAVLDF